MPKALLISCDEQNTLSFYLQCKIRHVYMNFRQNFSQKKNTFAMSEKNFSRNCSLHTQRLTQRKPLSRTFCSTLTYFQHPHHHHPHHGGGGYYTDPLPYHYYHNYFHHHHHHYHHHRHHYPHHRGGSGWGGGAQVLGHI